MGQRDRILRMLIDAYPDGVCGTVFLKAMMPRYGARIHELRAEGWDIQTERCRVHVHESRQTVYRLTSLTRWSPTLKGIL